MLTLTFTYADSDIYLCWRWHLLMLTLTFTYADSDIYLCWLWHLLMLTLTFTYADSDIYLCWLWHLLMLTLTFTYADADIYLCWRWHVPKCACDFKASCTRGRSFSALRHLKTKTEDRLCGLAMLHVHRNDTYRQVNPDAVIKRWDSSGDRKIHLVFTD
jgi:hypothetical protein